MITQAELDDARERFLDQRDRDAEEIDNDYDDDDSDEGLMWWQE